MRELTTEEIMQVVPEVIEATSIPLHAQSRIKPWQRRRGSAKRKWWSANDRIKAATTYALVGSAVEVERITGIPQTTVRVWKTQDWWPQIIERIRLEADDELDVKFTKVVDKAIGVVIDRMEKGDYVYDVGRGSMVRKPISSKDGATIATSFLDKRQLLRQKKDARMEEAGVTERLKKLAEEFEKFTKAKTIEGEVIQSGETPDQSKSGDSTVLSLHDIPVKRMEKWTSGHTKNTPAKGLEKYIAQMHPPEEVVVVEEIKHDAIKGNPLEKADSSLSG